MTFGRFTAFAAAALIGLGPLAASGPVSAEDMPHFAADPAGQIALLEAFYAKFEGMSDDEVSAGVLALFSALAAKSGGACDLNQEELNDPEEEDAAAIEMMKAFGLDAEPSPAAGAVFKSPAAVADVLAEIQAGPGGAEFAGRIAAIEAKSSGADGRLSQAMAGLMSSGKLVMSDDNQVLSIAGCQG